MNEKEKELIENVALRFGYSYEEIHRAFENIKRTFVSAWEALREIASTIASILVKRHEIEKYRGYWYVPKNIVKPHQVLDRTPLQANIRNRI